jgi:hypothetical protein
MRAACVVREPIRRRVLGEREVPGASRLVEHHVASRHEVPEVALHERVHVHHAGQADTSSLDAPIHRRAQHADGAAHAVPGVADARHAPGRDRVDHAAEVLGFLRRRGIVVASGRLAVTREGHA